MALTRLELSDNKLSGECIDQIVELYKETLQVLKLSNNKILSIAEIKKLVPCEGLIHLDLENNEITKITDYRETIFKTLPQLQVLDGKDDQNMSVYTDDDYGEEGELDMLGF